MIQVYKQGNKIIGVYTLFLSTQTLLVTKELKNYVMNKLLEELKKEEQSELFTYDIMKINLEESEDLFGKNCVIIFEFVPNKEMVDELKYLAERLQIGL